MIPILRNNLAHEDLTNQLLNFIENNIHVLGKKAIPLVVDVVNFCSTQLPYSRLLDVINIVNISVENYKLDSIQILEASYPSLLQKALEVPLPKTSVTDDEKDLIKLHDKMIQLMVNCVENLGCAFIFNQTLSSLIDPGTDWVLSLLVQTQSKETQRTILKVAKYELMVLKGVSV